jgi:hypothetical protein
MRQWYQANGDPSCGIKANGEVVKQPLFFETYNIVFTYATLDLKANWRQYRDSLEKEMRK